MREIWSEFFCYFFRNWWRSWRKPGSLIQCGQPNAGLCIDSPFGLTMTLKVGIVALTTSPQMDSYLSTYWWHFSTKRRHYFPSSGNWYRKESFAADRGKLANSSESSGCGTGTKTSNFVLVGSSSSVVKSLDQSTNRLNITDWRLKGLQILTSPRCYIAIEDLKSLKMTVHWLGLYMWN